MGFTKKAISVGLSATMLATLLATAFAGSAFAAAATLSVSPASPIVASGGTDVITLTSSGVTSGDTLTISTTGGTFTAISNNTTTGVWSTTPAVATPVTGTTTNAAGTSTVTLTAPAPGATITVTFTDTTSGGSATATITVAGSAPGVCANGPYGTAFPYCASATTQVADGVSYINLTWGAATSAANVLSISVTGAYFIAGSGGTPNLNLQTYPRSSIVETTVTNLNGASLWLASTTAGTATVTLSFSNGTSYTDSIASFTFTGATSTTVSTSYSSTSAASSSAAAVAGTLDLLTTTVADTNNKLIPVGASVTWTVTGPAIFATNNAQVSASTPVNGGKATINLMSTGVAGTATIATTVSYLGVTYTLANETVSFYGPVAKIVATNEAYSINSANTTTYGTGALDVALTDAAGNHITSGVTWGTPTYTPANFFTISALPTGLDAAGTGYLFNVTCVADGTATVSVNATTPALSSTSVTSNTVTFTCADGLGSTTPGTFTATAASTTVAPNGNTTITVKVLDDNKLPAPDGTPVVAVTNGVGAVVNTSGAANGTTSNGTATFTYLAPSNAGSGTVTIFVASATPASQAITFTIGTPAPAVAYTAASALGVTTSGPFSTATKLPKVGKYVTVKMSFGAANAGKNVSIYVATKTSGVWSAFKALTGRIANSNGDVFFYWKSASTAWLSIYGGISGVHSNAVQVRWM